MQSQPTQPIKLQFPLFLATALTNKLVISTILFLQSIMGEIIMIFQTSEKYSTYSLFSPQGVSNQCLYTHSLCKIKSKFCVIVAIVLKLLYNNSPEANDMIYHGRKYHNSMIIS